MIEPIGHPEMLYAVCSAELVLTDSGGLQEETTVLGVPCITIRENTERPVTVDTGVNNMVGTDPEKIRAVVFAILREMWIPEGFAHGFRVLSDSEDFFNMCMDFYFPEEERGRIEHR